MTDFLTVVRTTTSSKEDVLTISRPAPVKAATSDDAPSGAYDFSSVEGLLYVLRAQPSRSALKQALEIINPYVTSQTISGFDIRRPEPATARIITELVTTIVPNFWDDFRSDRHETTLFIGCLKHVAGISAVHDRLKRLAGQSNNGGRKEHSSSTAQASSLISLLESLLSLSHLSTDILLESRRAIKSTTKRRLLWSQYVTRITSGQIVSVVAQCESQAAENQATVSKGSWIGDGSKYGSWLGSDIADLIKSEPDDSHDDELIQQLLAKSFGLGYSYQIVAAILNRLALTSSSQVGTFCRITERIGGHGQKQMLEQTLRFCTRHFELGSSGNAIEVERRISCAAALIASLMDNSKALQDKLVSWMSDPVLASHEPLAARRAILAVIAANKDQDLIQKVLEENLNMFSESLFIQHSPIIHQEVCAETILLTAGHVHRTHPMFLFTLARSSSYMRGISARLDASSTRARTLGMCVASALSKLVDKKGTKLNFDVEEMQTRSAQDLLSLVDARDKIGSLEDAIAWSSKDQGRVATSASRATVDNVLKRQSPSAAMRPELPAKAVGLSGPRIVEVLDDEPEEPAQERLRPYPNPDSDPEDEEEDPTLINREKFKAPVYIRDLIAGLQDTEKYERHRLALTSAASLIRRKASFGKEVSDHTGELAAILASLGDTFDLENFAELRLQALIALIVADPRRQGPWFARQIFEGDYSLSQRGTLLSAMGLSARELAGYKDTDDLNPRVTAENSFPSKRLPDKYHKMYADQGPSQKTIRSTDPMQSISDLLERSMIQPLAASAADAASGPSALKVRTFSSRMDVAKRTKVVPNSLAKMLAEAFFFPLTGNWWAHSQAYGSTRNIHFQSFLLSTFLKTLSLLLHASGPGTVSLPQLTNEFWDLLLSVRNVAMEDVAVMEAILFGFLTLLETNEDKRRVAEENAKQLIETQEWVGMVFEGTSSGDAEGARARTLAASVLLQTKEVVDKYQRLLAGNLTEF